MKKQVTTHTYSAKIHAEHLDWTPPPPPAPCLGPESPRADLPYLRWLGQLALHRGAKVKPAVGSAVPTHLGLQKWTVKRDAKSGKMVKVPAGGAEPWIDRNLLKPADLESLHRRMVDGGSDAYLGFHPGNHGIGVIDLDNPELKAARDLAAFARERGFYMVPTASGRGRGHIYVLADERWVTMMAGRDKVALHDRESGELVGECLAQQVVGYRDPAGSVPGDLHPFAMIEAVMRGVAKPVPRKAAVAPAAAKAAPAAATTASAAVAAAVGRIRALGDPSMNGKRHAEAIAIQNDFRAAVTAVYPGWVDDKAMMGEHAREIAAAFREVMGADEGFRDDSTVLAFLDHDDSITQRARMGQELDAEAVSVAQATKPARSAGEGRKTAVAMPKADRACIAIMAADRFKKQHTDSEGRLNIYTEESSATNPRSILWDAKKRRYIEVRRRSQGEEGAPSLESRMEAAYEAVVQEHYGQRANPLHSAPDSVTLVGRIIRETMNAEFLAPFDTPEAGRRRTLLDDGRVLTVDMRAEIAAGMLTVTDDGNRPEHHLLGQVVSPYINGDLATPPDASALGLIDRLMVEWLGSTDHVEWYFEHVAAQWLLPLEFNERRLIFLIGVASAGKTTLENLEISCLGGTAKNLTGVAKQVNKRAVTRDPRQGEGQPRQLAFRKAMAGKRATYVSEMSSNDVLDSTMLKEVTGGSATEVGGMFMDSTQSFIRGMIKMTSNSIPDLGETGDAMERRAVAIPFYFKVVKKDTTLGGKLRERRYQQAFMWRVLEGVKRRLELWQTEAKIERAMPAEIADYTQRLLASHGSSLLAELGEGLVSRRDSKDACVPALNFGQHRAQGGSWWFTGLMNVAAMMRPPEDGDAAKEWATAARRDLKQVLQTCPRGTKGKNAFWFPELTDTVLKGFMTASSERHPPESARHVEGLSHEEQDDPAWQWFLMSFSRHTPKWLDGVQEFYWERWVALREEHPVETSWGRPTPPDDTFVDENEMVDFTAGVR